VSSASTQVTESGGEQDGTNVLVDERHTVSDPSATLMNSASSAAHSGEDAEVAAVDRDLVCADFSRERSTVSSRTAASAEPEHESTTNGLGLVDCAPLTSCQTPTNGTRSPLTQQVGSFAVPDVPNPSLVNSMESAVGRGRIGSRRLRCGTGRLLLSSLSYLRIVCSITRPIHANIMHNN